MRLLEPAAKPQDGVFHNALQTDHLLAGNIWNGSPIFHVNDDAPGENQHANVGQYECPGRESQSASSLKLLAIGVQMHLDKPLLF